MPDQAALASGLAAKIRTEFRPFQRIVNVSNFRLSFEAFLAR